MAINIVELAADADDCAFDQPCRFGHRVEGHAVYCHNDAWRDGPRKCRRTWYTGGSTKDEDCPGFDVNPDYKGALNPTPRFGSVCERCKGAKLILPERNKNISETCDLCQGTGAQPEPVDLSRDEVLVLESLIGCRYSDPWEEPHTIITGATCRLKELPERAHAEGWLSWNSVSFDGGVQVYLCRITMKGFAILKAHWAKLKAKDEFKWKRTEEPPRG